MKIHVLGCGSSGGVPLISGNWGRCNPDNPKNRRTRTSILVQVKEKNILIDASPDLREQLLRIGVNTIDAVLITHAHADHCHGLDELRQIFFHQQKKIPVYAEAVTLEKVQSMFSYMFISTHPIYPEYLTGHAIRPGTFMVDDLPITMFEQSHGYQQTSGFKIGSMAYSTDVKSFPKESEIYLKNLSLWIVDCLRYEEHHTHAHFELTMDWIKQFQPKRAILTHMCERIDYDDIFSRCPENVTPAYDRMILEENDTGFEC